MKIELIKHNEDGTHRFESTIICGPVNPDQFTGNWKVQMIKTTDKDEVISYTKTCPDKVQALSAWQELCMDLLWKD